MSEHLAAQELGTYASGFNQGMAKAATTFQTQIYILIALFAVRIIINSPPVNKRIQKHSSQKVSNSIEMFLDVFSLCVLISVAWALTGQPYLA